MQRKSQLSNITTNWKFKVRLCLPDTREIKSEHVIKGGDGPFEKRTTPIVDLGRYKFKILNADKIIPEEYFTN